MIDNKQITIIKVNEKYYVMISAFMSQKLYETKSEELAEQFAKQVAKEKGAKYAGKLPQEK